MAEQNDGAERTEQATPQKRQRSREEGQVAMSTEVAIAMTMVLLAGLIVGVFPSLTQDLVGVFGTRLSFDATAVRSFSDTSGHLALRQVAVVCLRVVGPVAGAALVVGALVNVAQVGVHPNMSLVAPKWSRLDPSSWFKRMTSAELPMQLGKSVFKGLGILALALFALRAEPERLAELTQATIPGIALRLQHFAFVVVVRVAGALAVVAGIDVLWTRYQFEEKMKMSRQEVKDEMKQTEGSPELKGALRRRMRERVQGSLESQVKEATVVSVNPTHYAVALRYWEGKDPSPRVLAKGLDFKAQRIRAIAKKHNIPIVEDVPLTRALYASVTEGQVIPLELYQSVAKLLAIVYNMRRNSAGGHE